MSDPATQILREIGRHVGPVSDPLIQSTDWASATYSGARHVIWFTCAAGTALDGFLRGISEHEFPMTGHFVADIEVSERVRVGSVERVRLAALTIES